MENGAFIEFAQTAMQKRETKDNCESIFTLMVSIYNNKLHKIVRVYLVMEKLNLNMPKYTYISVYYIEV